MKKNQILKDQKMGKFPNQLGRNEENYLKLKKIIDETKDDFINNPHLQEEEDAVLKEYGRMFDFNNIQFLTRKDFKEFWQFSNNRHWKHISRYSDTITEDMDKLRNVISFLLDENKPILERLNRVIFEKGDLHINHLHKAKLTPILFVEYPKKYCVYNEITKSAIDKLGLLPNFSRNLTFGEKYLKINNTILDISRRYDISLWKIDYMWWQVER